MDLSDRSTRMRVNKRFREKGIPAKVCGKCFVVKGHEAFSAHRSKSDGRQAACKDCCAGAYCRWYVVNRERAAEAYRRWHAANRDRKAETGRRRRETDPGYAKRWRAANPDKVRAYAQAQDARNASIPTEPFTASDLRHDWEDRDLWECFYCGGALTDGYDIEHYYPKFPDDEDTTPAGPHAVWNLVPSCVPCNRGVGGKHSREPWQFLRESLAEQGTDLDACLAILDGRR